MTIKGSCLCGSVRFEIKRALGPFEICHCTRCRKVSGGQGLPMLTVRAEDFEMTQGAANVVSFSAPILYQAPAYQSHRCAKCGSPVPMASDEDSVLEVPAGLLDGDPELLPDKHIFVEFLPAWDQITDTLPQYDLPALIKQRTGRNVADDFVIQSHRIEAAMMNNQSSLLADDHDHFMGLALQASTQALPDCAPNPPVGCVLVKDHRVISTGYTRGPGEPHAEADALARWPGSLNDVSAYVTLEPCSFHGRTPSCAMTLIERGFKQVYVGMIDPDPRNNGKGIAMLREAGVVVTVGVMNAAVMEFLSPHLNQS